MPVSSPFKVPRRNRQNLDTKPSDSHKARLDAPEKRQSDKAHEAGGMGPGAARVQHLKHEGADANQIVAQHDRAATSYKEHKASTMHLAQQLARLEHVPLGEILQRLGLETDD
ncbi:hypothetical protein BMF94_2834 [Rhodotorula taiwanensis]|uniref:Uncharacterized protein n=1 Tax=Rhodotorula taiwanensis TaxID=741276 RepID=A0A2S5BB87_9BASI|nr:hypothetical protein BMF94_2834 [Rhodotorula taiwanensis]